VLDAATFIAITPPPMKNSIHDWAILEKFPRCWIFTRPITFTIIISDRITFNICVQIHPTRISYWIPREESSLSRVVVAVGEEEETGLVVRIVPPLRVVPEGIVGIGD